MGLVAAATTTFAAPSGAATSFAVWDRVAHCESSGNWHINTGNGYYGGLQFSASTWAAYHGHKYASQANRATRLEQIEVARRVLSAQGAGAWPVCGPRAGLNRGSGHATSAALPTVAGHPSASHPKPVAHKPANKRRSTTKSTHHRYYRVRRGDTLSKIAREYHIAGGWPALYRANRSRLSNPNVVRVGQVLVLP